MHMYINANIYKKNYNIYVEKYTIYTLRMNFINYFIKYMNNIH